jgi:hypothetical protein
MSGTKQRQTANEIKRHLQEQIAFLKASCEAYDNGVEAEAKRLASTLRLLLHDKGKSTSLLSQSSLKSIDFVNTAYPIVQENKVGHHGLVSQCMPPGAEVRFMPFLDQYPSEALGKSSFDDWWTQTVIVDRNGASFSRSRLVLEIADTDGGAHVDPTLKDDYAKLSRENSLGWVQGSAQPILAVELASARQIAHELLKSLDPTYSKMPDFPKGSGVFRGMIVVVNDDADALSKTRVSASPSPVTSLSVTSSIENRRPKAGRNTICPCGSGKKFKHCHGQLS